MELLKLSRYRYAFMDMPRCITDVIELAHSVVLMDSSYPNICIYYNDISSIVNSDVHYHWSSIYLGGHTTQNVEYNNRLIKTIKTHYREIIMDNDEMIYERFLTWRNINKRAGDEPCDRCSGSGGYIYGSTSTWHGGLGGATMTYDICDKCWGSGNMKKPWLNLRTLPKPIQ